jgi:cytidylate kinase
MLFRSARGIRIALESSSVEIERRFNMSGPDHGRAARSNDSSGTTVLAISRQLGSGGALIGQTVARRLGLRYADRDILHEAALALGVEDGAVEPLEERVEGFWERIGHMFALALGSPEGPIPLTIPMFDQADLFALEQRMIREIASRDNAVIVGRGAAHVLRDHPGLISIFVSAPESVRVSRVMEAFRLEDIAETTTLVERSDKQRAAFVEALTGRDWMTTSLYDICLNTAAIGLDAAADIVTGIAARRMERHVAAFRHGDRTASAVRCPGASID